jgi:hypothetical protein
LRVGVSQRFDTLAWISGNHRTGCGCLDAVIIFGSCRESEEIAGKQEIHNLASPVRFNDAAQGCAGDHAIPGIGCLSLSADFLPPAAGFDRRNGIEALQRMRNVLRCMT